jgi:hypothetical protein
MNGFKLEGTDVTEIGEVREYVKQLINDSNSILMRPATDTRNDAGRKSDESCK